MRRFLELATAAGALLGLVTVGGPGPVRSVWAVAAPYPTHALAGAAIGLAAGLLVLLVWHPRGAAPSPRREAIPQRVRHEVWRRDRGSCVECGSRGRLEFDHIIPVSRGGSNTTRNIELRCEPCNRRKGARI
jgi:HNH endonuclease